MHSTVKILTPALVLTLGLIGVVQAAGGQSQSSSLSQASGQVAQGETKTLKGTVKKVEGKVYTIRSDQGKEFRLRIEKDAFKGTEPKEGDKIQAKVRKGEQSFTVLSAKKAGQSSASQRSGGTGQTEMMSGKVEKVEGNIFTIKTDQGKKVEIKIERQALQGPTPKQGDQLQAEVTKAGSEPYQALSAKKARAGSSMQAQSASGNQAGKFTKTITGKIQKVQGNIYYVQDSSGKEIRLRLDQSAQTSGELKKGDEIEVLVTKEKEFHVISAEAAQ